MKVLLAVIALIAIGSTGFAAYHFGDKTGERSGYAVGYKKGRTDGYDQAPKATVEMATAQINYENLQQKYNTLVTDYNNLRNAALNYVNTSQYQIRQPITCNTYSPAYSSNSSTTCY